MIYDCFPFFNELDILKLHLSVMNPLVDKFVIEEARYTFSGQPKELCFEANKDMFSEWLPKIEYIVVDDPGEGLETHLRDKFQKNHLEQGLKDATDSDVIILGDVDEIPNPETVKSIIDNFDSNKVYHLAQRMFYVYLNMEEVSGNLLSITGEFPLEKRTERRMWLGTKIFARTNIPNSGIIEIREVAPEDPRSVRVSNGGWHFGYMGSKHETDVAKRIGTKVVAAAHQEYNTEDYLKEAADRLRLGQDIFGRDAKFERVEIDNSFPAYIRDNFSEYDYLIMPKTGAAMKVLLRIKLKVFRFCRKVRRKLLRSATSS